MDYDKLIERMKCPQIHSCPMDGEYPSCKVCQKSIQQETVTAIETLQVENQALRNAANGFKAENSMLRKMQPVELSEDAATSFALAQEVSRLRAELENEHAHRIHAEQHADAFLRDCEQLNAELERVTAERDGAVSDLELFATCDTCKFGEMKMAYDCLGCDHASNWKWRGVKKED